MLDPVDASRAELICQPAIAPGQVGEVDKIADRPRGIEEALLDFHRRVTHRETVIDRLHEENQQLRADLRRGILEPVVTELHNTVVTTVSAGVARAPDRTGASSREGAVLSKPARPGNGRLTVAA